MNIFVLGNGFDIAHGLPTTYIDFMKFIDMAEEIISKSYVDDMNFTDILNPSAIDDKLMEHLKGGGINYLLSIKEDFMNYYNNNFWINYFKNRLKNTENKLGETWIDFESIISYVIKGFDYSGERGFISLREYDPDLYNFVNLNIPIKKVKFKGVKAILIKDLENLINLLEIYLHDFIGELKVEVISPDIKELQIGGVLSFNYTETYKKLYDSRNDIEYSYIHGKVRENSLTDNNMVLGIDEYLNDAERNINIDYMEFKKYFQRIYKKTGSSYKDWLEPVVMDGNCYMYFWGHSLDITDKDIIRELILNKWHKKIIFYHNKETLKKLIGNLIKVIGQDNLIKLTGDPDPNIEFRLQKAMEKNTKHTSSCSSVCS